MIAFIVGIIGIGLVSLVLFVAWANSNIADNQAKIANAAAMLAARFGDGDYHTVLPGPRFIGIAWGQETLIIGDSVADAVAIPLANVRSADIELDGVNVTNTTTKTTTNRGSQLAGGLVGGALLGPAGLIVGGLSGGSTSKGKAVETRNIQSVRLVLRVTDRTAPIRTFTFFDMPYGDGYPGDSPIVAPAIAKANHFHALLTQAIEDRDGQATVAIRDRSFGASAVAILMLIASLGVPRPAHAYELGKTLAGTPETKLASSNSLDQVERCIVMADLAAPPVVYRTQDGSRSLIHGGRSQPIFAFELIRNARGVDVLVWQGKGYQDKFQSCL